MISTILARQFGKRRGRNGVRLLLCAFSLMLLLPGCNDSQQRAEGMRNYGSEGGASSDEQTPETVEADTVELAAKTESPGAVLQEDPVLVVHDFGIARQNTVLRHAFGVKNLGDEPLILDSLTSSCICTVVNGSSETIAPGETEYYELALSTKNSKGNINGQVLAEFRNGRSEHASVVFEGIAAVYSEMSPSAEEVRWFVLEGDEPQVQVVDIQNFSDTEWSAVKASESPAWIRVKDLSPIQVSTHLSVSPRQAWRATLAVDASQLPPAAAAGAIRFSTDDDEKECTVKVFYRESPAVQLSTSSLHLGTIHSGVAVHRSVVVNFADATIAETLLPERSCPQVSLSDSTGLSVEQNWKWIDDKSGLLSLEFNAGSPSLAASGMVNGSLRLSLSDRASESIPLFGRVVAAANLDAVR